MRISLKKILLGTFFSVDFAFPHPNPNHIAKLFLDLHLEHSSDELKNFSSNPYKPYITEVIKCCFPCKATSELHHHNDVWRSVFLTDHAMWMPPGGSNWHQPHNQGQVRHNYKHDKYTRIWLTAERGRGDGWYSDLVLIALIRCEKRKLINYSEGNKTNKLQSVDVSPRRGMDLLCDMTFIICHQICQTTS